MRSSLALWVVLAGAVWLQTDAARADMRCDNRLVSNGASMYDVRSLCGPPDSTEHRTEHRTVRRRVTGRCPAGATVCNAEIDDTVEISVDEWIYDFGPQRFVQYLTFEDGKLVLVRAGNYGHKKQ